MDLTTISVIANAVLSVVGVLLAKYWLTTKTKLADLKGLVDIMNAALADDKLSAEELAAVQLALMKLISKP